MNRFNFENKGFALIELMMALALLLIVLSLGFTLYFFGTNAFERGTAQSYLQQNARIVDDYLKKELRNAGRITVTYEGDHDSYYLGYFKIDSEGHLLHNGNKVTEAVISDIVISKEYDNSTSETFIRYEITTTEKQDFYVETKVLLNNLISPDTFSTGTESKRSLNDYVLYYYSPGDPLPDGHAFIDKNGNKIYDRGSDIPIPIEDLKSSFDTHTYVPEGGSSLVVPSSVGTISIDSSETLDWTACEDIIIGVDIVSETFNDLSFTTDQGDIEFFTDNTIDVNSSIKFHSGNKIRANSLSINNLSGNGEINIFSLDNIMIRDLSINSAADVNIRSEKGDIVASGINLFKGEGDSKSPIGNVVIETGKDNAGNIVPGEGRNILLNNALIKADSITLESNQSIEAIEATLESNNNIGIDAEGDIYLYKSNITGGSNNTNVSVISSSSIYAALLEVNSAGDVDFTASGEIILDGSEFADFADGGSINISADNISVSTYVDPDTSEPKKATLKSNISIAFVIKSQDYKLLLDIQEAELNSESITIKGDHKDEEYLDEDIFIIKLNNVHLTIGTDPNKMIIYDILEEYVDGVTENGGLEFKD